MPISRILIVTALTAAMARPAVAQRGVPPARPNRPTQTPAKAQKSDTTRKPAAGVSLDFQDQDLRVVLDALAAAGDLNVSLTNIPQQRVTLHMGQPVARDSMLGLVKQFAESQGLKVTQAPGLMQIAGPTPEPASRQTPAQMLAMQLAQQNQAQAIRLFTYRLKHASAVQLAPTLTNLFTGGAGGQAGSFRGGTTTIIPNGNGGFTTLQTGPPNNITAGVAGNTTIPTPFNPGRGGRGNQGNVGNAQIDGARGANIAQQLSQAFQQISGALSNQSAEIRIIPEESTNSLLIRATDSDWALIEQVIQGVDLRPLQVLIEVTIAEVQRTHDFDLGVSGGVRKTNGKGFDSVAAVSVASARDFIVQLTGGHGGVNYNVAISALEERGNVRVLSLPVIIAQNNRQATLNVGSSRPFVQLSQSIPNDPTATVQTVQYIDVGTVLTITPTINPDGYVNLQVQQTDNSASNQVQFNAPIINKREATTQVFVRDGQTTVIGGLADNQHSRDVSGIPGLSRIPLIGPLLFGSTTRNDETSELFLFLTPHIISSDEDIDRLNNAVRNGSELLKDVNIGPRIVPMADTLPAGTKINRPDSPKKDSLSTMRRRPPAAPSDTAAALPITLVPADTSSSASTSSRGKHPWR